MRRTVALAALLLLVLAPVGGGLTVAASSPQGSLGGQAAPAATPNETVTPTPNGTPTATPTATPNETASTPNGTPRGGPTLAQQARVTAVKFSKPYLKVRRSGHLTWNTTGPYVIFAVSQNVEAARVKQPNARAKVLDGGRAIKVTYDENAAPSSGQSLYTVTLFFRDGSRLDLTLYASGTNQHVASKQLLQAQPLLRLMRQDAKAHGYNATIQGMMKYHKWEREQADLLNNLFSEQFAKLFAWLIVTARTPFALMLLLGSGAYFLRRFVKTHEWKLKAQLRGGNAAQEMRRRLVDQYRRDRVAADEEKLEDLDEIGHNWVHWQDAYGVSTVKQLADLFAEGRLQRDAQGNLIRYDPDDDVDPVTNAKGEVLYDEDGDPLMPPKYAHRGIDDLEDAESIRDTWLGRIIREDRLGDAASALSHAKRALLRITTEYGQTEYDQARAKVKELQRQVVNQRTEEARSVRTQPGATAGDAGSRSTGAAGGDD